MKNITYCFSLSYLSLIQCYFRSLAETQGKYTLLQWRTIHLGGLYHLEQEISMTTTVPNFIGEIQQFHFNNVPYIELARASSTDQPVPGFPTIKVAAKFVKRATDNLHRPVTFRSKHTFIGMPMLRAYSSIHIDFMFKTKELNGLIMFNGGKKVKKQIQTIIYMSGVM